jgi:hypothetical protein
MKMKIINNQWQHRININGVISWRIENNGVIWRRNGVINNVIMAAIINNNVA